jgi:hypothetical protein
MKKSIPQAEEQNIQNALLIYRSRYTPSSINQTRTIEIYKTPY